MPGRAARQGARRLLAALLLLGLVGALFPVAGTPVEPVPALAAPDATAGDPTQPLPLLGALAADPALAHPVPALPAPAQTPNDAPAPAIAPAVAQQNLDEQATLEVRRPEAQWSPSGSEDWQTVPNQQTVRSGDRVRTGAGASARLVYFEGSVTEISPSTGILVQRLQRSEGGNIVTNLFQSVGTTVNRVVQLVDPAAGFQVETPSATAFVRGTTPRVDVNQQGASRISNLPDATGGLVDVVGKDANQTRITLQAGQETFVAPGLPPNPPAPLGTFAQAIGPLGTAAAAGPGQAAAQQQQQQQQQQQRQLQQQQLREQAAQMELGVIAAEAELNRLAQQEAALAQQVLQFINPTATTGISSQPPPGSRVTPIPTAQAVPCAQAVGQTCVVPLAPVGGSTITGSASGVVTASMSWTVTLNGLTPGTAAAVVFQTTVGFETIACPVAVAGQPTVCRGPTLGNALLGSTIQVLLGSAPVAQGTVGGTPPAASTATRTPTAPPVVITPTSTSSPTPTSTAVATTTTTTTPMTTTPTLTPATTATRTPTSAATLTFTPQPTATPTRTPTPTPTHTPPILFVKNLGTAAGALPGPGFNSLTLTTTSGAAAGNNIIVGIAATASTAASVSCTDSASPPNVYSQDVRAANGTNVITFICSAHNINALPPGGSISVTLSSSANDMAISANEFSGLSLLVPPRDLTTTGFGTSTSVTTSPTGTTSQANELLFGAVGIEPPANFTPGSNGTGNVCTNTASPNYSLPPMSIAGSPNISLFVEYCIVSVPGMYVAQGTLDFPHNWAAGLVTYRGRP